VFEQAHDGRAGLVIIGVGHGEVAQIATGVRAQPYSVLAQRAA
jgi:hypothetical protein